MSVFVTCPHCQGTVEILEINCAIFRHAVYKRTGAQLSPHASKAECDQLAEQGQLYGCAKPFRIVTNDNLVLEAVPCDYI